VILELLCPGFGAARRLYSCHGPGGLLLTLTAVQQLFKDTKRGLGMFSGLMLFLSLFNHILVYSDKISSFHAYGDSLVNQS
jgi:hypothetical protein